MKESEKNKPVASIASKISPRKMIYPVLIGLGFVGYMMYNNFDIRAFDIVKFTWHSVFWLIIAIVFMLFRDIGYVYRIKVLSNNQLNLAQSVRIIMLWEFTSAITPSAVGGTGLAIIFVNKEGISIGKSTAIVMATSFLDELYFVIMFPLLLFFINPYVLFFENSSLSFANEFFLFALIGYTIKFLYVILISYGLFRNPRGVKKLIVSVFKIRFLRKWRYRAAKAGTEIMSSSIELRNQKFIFWIKAFLATFFSWTSRYWVVNAIILAFFVVNDHILLFARQLVMWIMMLISPTPGGSGFTEFVFTKYLGDFLPEIAGVAILMAAIWRLITYYPYLIIGSLIVPPWIRNKFVEKNPEIK